MINKDPSKEGRYGVPDLRELGLYLAIWLEVWREGLDACTLAPRQPAGLLQHGSLRMAQDVFVFIREVPALLPAVSQIRPRKLHHGRSRMKRYVPPVRDDRKRWSIPRSLPVARHIVPGQVPLRIVRSLVELAGRPQWQVLDRFTVRGIGDQPRLLPIRLTVRRLREHKHLLEVLSDADKEEPFAPLGDAEVFRRYDLGSDPVTEPC